MAVIALGAVLGYELLAKPAISQGWGATRAEAHEPLPGDGFVAEPASQITRAITIAATPAQVWPWLVQLGADRGGFYSYDRLEDLFGLDIHSAAEIVDEWQTLHIGDVVYATRKRTGGWYVVGLLREKALMLQLADLRKGRPVRRGDAAGWEFLWMFVLRETSHGDTRLIVRERVAFGSPIVEWLARPVGLVSFVMTRRMMIGIRDRAEQHNSDSHSFSGT